MRLAFSPARRSVLALLAVLALPGAWAQAPAYPDRPIKLVVGYPAGGAVDIIARTVGQAMSSSMGQPIVVENKPGAGTNIAVKSVIGAAPDGYTLMLAANALAANMALYQPAPFDAEKDLVLISQVGRVPVVIAANPTVPYNTVAQLIAAAKARPGGICEGTSLGRMPMSAKSSADGILSSSRSSSRVDMRPATMLRSPDSTMRRPTPAPSRSSCIMRSRKAPPSTAS